MVHDVRLFDSRISDRFRQYCIYDDDDNDDDDDGDGDGDGDGGDDDDDDDNIVDIYIYIYIYIIHVFEPFDVIVWRIHNNAVWVYSMSPTSKLHQVLTARDDQQIIQACTRPPCPRNKQTIPHPIVLSGKMHWLEKTSSS